MKEYIQGLLSDPTFNLGVGLLQASGPRPVTTGFGDVLAGGMQFASERQKQQMQMDVAREQMSSQKRQRDAQAQLGAMLPPGMGTFMEAYPGIAPTVASGMMPQPARQEAAFNTYVSMGGDPSDMQAYQEFKAGLDPNAQLETEMLQLQIANAQTEQQMNAEEVRDNRVNQQQTLRSTMKNVAEMIEINDRLKGTVLAPGTPAGELVKTGLSARDAIARTFGNDAKYDNVIADYNTFSKMANALNLETFGQLSGIPTSTASLQILQNSQPGVDLDPTTNDRVLRSLMGGLVEDAGYFSSQYKDYAISVPEKYKGLTQINEQANDIDFSTLSDEELEALANGSR